MRNINTSCDIDNWASSSSMNNEDDDDEKKWQWKKNRFLFTHTHANKEIFSDKKNLIEKVSPPLWWWKKNGKKVKLKNEKFKY